MSWLKAPSCAAWKFVAYMLAGDTAVLDELCSDVGPHV
jgi:hypothetical protein